MRDTLIKILSIADERTALICGKELAYYQNGTQKIDNSFNWSDYNDIIISDEAFVCDTYNMQLSVKLR